MSDLMKVGADWGGTGTFKPLTSGYSGAQRIVDAHGRYYDSSMARRRFFAATQSGQTTSAGLTVTYVGCVVSNPIASPVNLLIDKIGWSWTVIAAAVNNVGIAVGYSPSVQVIHTTAISASSTVFSNTSTGGWAKADSSATLPIAPVYYMFIDNTPTATTNVKGGVIDLEGSLIIPPGGFVCTVTSAASSAAAFWASIQWEEVPSTIT